MLLWRSTIDLIPIESYELSVLPSLYYSIEFAFLDAIAVSRSVMLSDFGDCYRIYRACELVSFSYSVQILLGSCGCQVFCWNGVQIYVLCCIFSSCFSCGCHFLKLEFKCCHILGKILLLALLYTRGENREIVQKDLCRKDSTVAPNHKNMNNETRAKGVYVI